MHARLFFAVTAALVVVAGCSKYRHPNASGEGVEVGQRAPEIAGVDLDGRSFKLSDYRGKVVMLDFWRTM